MRMSWLLEFLACERGTAAVEFVVALPLSVALTVMAAEYGNGLMAREQLDSALSDATRLLSRAPLDLAVDPATGDTQPTFYPDFLADARRILSERTGVAEGDIAFFAQLQVLTGDTALRTQHIVIETRVAIPLDLRLLAFLRTQLLFGEDGSSIVKTGLMMNSRDRARYVGELLPGQRACPQIARAEALCGGPV